MTDRKIIRGWTPGDALAASRFNELVRSANRALYGGTGVLVTRTANGDTVSVPRSGIDAFILQITASDDVSSSDWSDNRYFGHRQRITSNDGDSDIVGTVNDTYITSDWVVATNLFETGGSHLLRSGDYALAFTLTDNQDPPRKQTVLVTPPRGSLRWAWAKQTWSEDVGYGGGMLRAFPVSAPGAKQNEDSDKEFTCHIHSVYDSDGVVHGTPNATSGMYFAYEFDNGGLAWATYPPSVVEDGIAGVTIRPFVGVITDIPTGWKFCDGANGTPDMRGRFLVGAYSDAGAGLPADSDIGAGGDYNCIGEICQGPDGYLLEIDLAHQAHTHCTICCEATAGAGQPTVIEVSEFTIPAHSEFIDVRPPWIVMGFMQRSDNSIAWTGE